MTTRGLSHLVTTGAWLFLLISIGTLPAAPVAAGYSLAVAGAATAGARLVDSGSSASNLRVVLRGQSAPVPPRSKGFLNDLLEDENGATIQRLQLIVTTLILGTAYLIRCWTGLSLPTLDAGATGLHAFSAATYLAAKLAESKA